MNQHSPKSGRSSGKASARVRNAENYLDALHPVQPYSLSSSRSNVGRSSHVRSGSSCVLARTYQEKAAPSRLQRKMPLGVKRVLSAAQLTAKLTQGWCTSSLEGIRRELRPVETVKSRLGAAGKVKPGVFLAFGLGLSSVAMAETSYQIQSGDTLWAIARANNLSVDQLKAANNLTEDTIYAGEQLTLPASALGPQAQAAEQARAAQKAALLSRLSDLKQERETRQAARGLPVEVSPEVRNEVEKQEVGQVEVSKSVSSAKLGPPVPQASTTQISTPLLIAEQAVQPPSSQQVLSFPSTPQSLETAQQARAVEKQKLLNRLSQTIGQDRRAVQIAQANDSTLSKATVTSAASSIPVTSSATTEVTTKPSQPQVATSKTEVQERAQNRTAEKAAIVARLQKLEQARIERRLESKKLEQARQKQQAQRVQARQVQARRVQARLVQKRLEQKRQAAQVNTSRHSSRVRSAAYRYVGLRYQMGGTGRGSIDCSAFTQATLRDLGYRVPRTARAQSGAGYWVSFRNLRTGDLVFFNTLGRGVSHTGIYLGGGMFANANSYRGRVVVESIHAPYWASRFVTARRVMG